MRPAGIAGVDRAAGTATRFRLPPPQTTSREGKPMLKPSHQQEWRSSGVDRQIIELNVLSLEGEQAWEFLFYSDRIKRLNSGRLATGLLNAYQHIEQGGWWCSGLDPLNNWAPMIWGRFKPDAPRFDFSKGDGKKVRYESPLKTPARVTYFRVTLAIWQQISDRYCVPMPEQITILDTGEALGFWAWVQAHPQIPVILTEGEKKAACLLSFGFAAIALPGIWMGRRKSAKGVKLHPDLSPIAPGRKFIILFDYETNPKTRTAIRAATVQTGQALGDQGGLCEVAVLPGPEKGVDDWAFALPKQSAATALSRLIDDALTLQDYQHTAFANRCRGLHNHQPKLIVNTRFLSNAVQLPTRGGNLLSLRLGNRQNRVAGAVPAVQPRSQILKQRTSGELIEKPGGPIANRNVLIAESERFVSGECLINYGGFAL